jgi:hypothetical protein
MPDAISQKTTFCLSNSMQISSETLSYTQPELKTKSDALFVRVNTFHMHYVGIKARVDRFFGFSRIRSLNG